MTDRPMTETLKPCPFDGATGEEVSTFYDTANYPGDPQDWFVRCLCCCIETQRYGTEAEAITAWNRRSTSAAVRGMREALERARRELYDALHSHMSEAAFLEEVDYINAVLSGIETEQAPTNGGDNGQA